MTDSVDPHIRSTLSLLLTPGLGPTLAGRMIKQLGSADAACHAPTNALAAVAGISGKRAPELRRLLDQTLQSEAVDRELELAARHQARLIPLDHPGYPKLLRYIPDPPPLLYVQGELLDTDAVAVAIVGSRKCSSYGRTQAARFASLLSDTGLTIVSGGAYGIDAEAHRAVVRSAGRTIAVIGSGLANRYPDAHEKLFDQIIAEQRGAIVSELPMAMGPLAKHFPRRNRIISGMSLGVLVIEAAIRSGALITARQAVEEHQREVMALPGRVDTPTALGCLKIIREGWAALVTDLPDVLACLGETGSLLAAAGIKADHAPALSQYPPQPPAPLFSDSDQTANDPAESHADAIARADAGSPADPAAQAADLAEVDVADADAVRRAVMQALDEPATLDRLVQVTQLPAGPVQAAMTILQVQGMVRRDGSRFVRLR